MIGRDKHVYAVLCYLSELDPARGELASATIASRALFNSGQRALSTSRDGDPVRYSGHITSFTPRSRAGECQFAFTVVSLCGAFEVHGTIVRAHLSNGITTEDVVVDKVVLGDGFTVEGTCKSTFCTRTREANAVGRVFEGSNVLFFPSVTIKRCVGFWKRVRRMFKECLRDVPGVDMVLV